MPPADNKEWRPPVEDFFYDEVGMVRQGIFPVMSSVVDLMAVLEETEEVAEYPRTGISGYLDQNPGSPTEFLVHPNHLETALEDYREFYTGLNLDSWSWDEDIYENRLQKTARDAEEEGRPVFVLYSQRVGEDDQETSSYMEEVLGLESDSYRMLPTVPNNGIVEENRGLAELATILRESPEMDARVSGQIHGRCTAQYETVLQAVSDLSENLDVDVKRGLKFPLLPFTDSEELAEPSQTRSRRARNQYEHFLEREF